MHYIVAHVPRVPPERRALPPALHAGAGGELQPRGGAGRRPTGGVAPSTVDAVGEEERRAEVASPERVAAAPVLRPALLHLACSVHRERARSREPPLVSRALEQRQECVSVPRCAVAEARALSQRPGAPRQLAAGDRELLVEDVRERRDDPRRAVAPLRADLAVAVFVKPLPSIGGQLTSPSSSTAKRRSVSETPAASPSASTQPANPCAGPR